MVNTLKLHLLRMLDVTMVSNVNFMIVNAIIVSWKTNIYDRDFPTKLFWHLQNIISYKLWNIKYYYFIVLLLTRYFRNK